MIKFISIMMINCCFIIAASENINWIAELNNLDKIIEKEYKEKYSFVLEATGGGGVKGFNLYSPVFRRYSIIKEAEARNLVFEIAEDLLQKINHNEILRNAMISYPFTPKNLGFTIFFSKSDGYFVDKGEIFCIDISDRFVTYGYKTKLYEQSEWRDEPIKEALLKIKGSREKFPFIWECVEKQEREGK